jgi:hypothetical protein
MQRSNRTAWVLVSAVLSTAACSGGSDNGVEPGPERVISVGVYIDGYHDCDGPPNGLPDVCEGVGAARIALLGPAGDDSLDFTSTSTQLANKGVGVFHDVEPGTYRVTVAAFAPGGVLGDTLEIQAMELRQQSGSGWLPGTPVPDFSVSFSDDVVYVNLRLVYTQTP